jgi:hypothetical protein
MSSSTGEILIRKLGKLPPEGTPVDVLNEVWGYLDSAAAAVDHFNGNNMLGTVDTHHAEQTLENMIQVGLRVYPPGLIDVPALVDQHHQILGRSNL